jgi:hypothetical protein
LIHLSLPLLTRLILVRRQIMRRRGFLMWLMRWCQEVVCVISACQ